jgi:hypothetical protein
MMMKREGQGRKLSIDEETVCVQLPFFLGLFREKRERAGVLLQGVCWGRSRVYCVCACVLCVVFLFYFILFLFLCKFGMSNVGIVGSLIP